MAIRFVCMALCWLACARPASAEKPVMHWMMPDFPPGSIMVDGKPTSGVGDRIVLFLAAGMPEFEHRFSAPNPKRIWALLTTPATQACYLTGVITPERRKIAYFAPLFMSPPHQIVARPEVFERLRRDNGETDFAALIADPALRGIVATTRSYGATLDAVIAGRPSVTGLIVAQTSNDRGNLLKMVHRGRADYTLEYDFVLSYQTSLDKGLATLKAVPVKGNSALLPVGVACPRTVWGLDMITRIDRLLATSAGADASRRALEAWLTPDTRARYRDELDRFFRARLSPTPADKF